MAANIRNTNLRFNLEKDLQRKAWEYLQTMDKQEFRSYSQVIALALVEYFDRYYRTQEDPYLETREREERFVDQILKAVEKCVSSPLPFRPDSRDGTKGAPKQGIPAASQRTGARSRGRLGVSRRITGRRCTHDGISDCRYQSAALSGISQVPSGYGSE